MIDFAALQSAVKPKARTDQYVVISALYHLGGYDHPVTARKVADLLKLNLGKNAPENVSACLRAYKDYVEPVAKGPPLQWKLTSMGLDRLAELSGLALSRKVEEQAFGSDVGIICALEYPEMAAITKAFGGASKWRETGSPRFAHIYREIELRTAAGAMLKAIATTSMSMGLTAAAIATTQLVLQFRPRLVGMVGIAAGTHSRDKAFGDVLVADPSVDYNSGKVVFSKGIRDFEPDPYPIGLNPRLRSVLQKYRGNHPVFLKIQSRWKGPKPATPNRLHVGPLGAADQVVDDATRIVEIQRNWRKLIGVEMETYGVYRACYEAPDPKPRFVSFKSVCDFAANKTDSWQDYAAFVAAEFSVEFLKTEWESLWSGSTT
jgi:nucleoside phosphorylase